MAADLESAADTALMKVKELEAHVEEAQDAFTALQEAIEEAGSQLETDWSALEPRVEALLKQVAEEQRRVGGEAEEAEDALENLKGATEHTGTEGKEAADHGREATEEMAEKVEGSAPRVASLVEQIESACTSLREQTEALDGQLSKALLEARDFLQEDVAGELRTMRQAVEERLDEAQTALTEECRQALEAKYEDWETKLAHVESLVEKGFDDAREHVEEVVHFSLTECVEGHKQGLKVLEDAGKALRSAAEALAEASGQRQETLETEGQSLQDALGETVAGVEAMLEALGRVTELLQSFSFVQ